MTGRPDPHEPLRGTGDLRLAVVVDPTLPLGFLANTVATISVGLGAARPGLGAVRLTDATGLCYATSADRPVPILQADGATLTDIVERTASRQSDVTLVLFPAFARELHGFPDYQASVPTRDLRGGKLDGLGICGPAKLVKSLTGSLKLLR